MKTLVDRIHANSVAPVRQDLQTKVTNAFAHLNTGAPIVRKEMVGKKTFFIWWNIFMKISTSPFKLSIDESNCQSYSATLSSVYFSRCLNPLLSLLLSYPSVWLSGWLSSRLFFLPNSHSFVQNQFTTYVLVLFPTVRWIQMTPSTVCFGARDDSYGFFRTAKAGNIITFKLTYKSGYVTCHSSNPSYQSKWGCLWNRLIPNQMATLITDKNRNLLLPKSDSYQIFGTASFTSCLGPQPNRHDCSLIISLHRWRWWWTENSKAGTARTCSNGVMAITWEDPW